MDNDILYGRIEQIERIAPRMIRVVLGGQGLASFEPTTYTDQYVNALFIPDIAAYDVPFDLALARERPPGERPIGRRYTVRAWNPIERLVTIDFVVHGDEGVAGRWANQAEVGDLLQIVGPGGGYQPDPDADWYLMVGDESALPAIAASLERIPVGRTAIAVLLVDGPDHEIDLDCPGDLLVTWLHRDASRDAHRDPADVLSAAVEDLDFPVGHMHGFIHGEAGEVRAVRRHLLGDRRIERQQLSISPYWRRNYTDERWREVKNDWLTEVEADV